MKRVILPTLATVLVVAAIAGVFIVRSHAPSPRLQVGHHVALWTMYHDPLGLFTINYPAGWKATGSISTGGRIIMPNYTIDMAGTSDGVDITEVDNPKMTLHIGAIKFTTQNTESYFCQHLSYPFYASGNLPGNLPAGSAFNTTNAHFQIDIGPPYTDAAVPATTPRPTPVPASTIHAEMTTYNSILATFHSLAPKGSSC